MGSSVISVRLTQPEVRGHMGLGLILSGFPLV